MSRQTSARPIACAEPSRSLARCPRRAMRCRRLNAWRRRVTSALCTRRGPWNHAHGARQAPPHSRAIVIDGTSWMPGFASSPSCVGASETPSGHTGPRPVPSARRSGERSVGASTGCRAELVRSASAGFERTPRGARLHASRNAEVPRPVQVSCAESDATVVDLTSSRGPI